MKDLPDDIIREIFIACLSGPVALPPQPHEPRLALSHVCAAWREIALSTPKLWSEMVIDHSVLYDHSLEDDSDGSDDPGHSILPTWFARSGQHLLSLQVTRVFRGLRPFFDEYVFPNLHRCRELKLLVPPTLVDQLFHSPRSFHYLEVMELEATGPGAGGITHHVRSRKPVTSFQVAIRLRRVVLFLDELSLDLPSLNLQWQQLSVLIIKGALIPATRCLDALRECISLEECEISVTNGTHGQAGTPNRPVVLPSLHTIRLGFSVLFNSCSEFLASLHLPGLRRFRLMAGTAGLSLAALQPFLTPASHKLEELDITDIRRSSPAELRAFLAALPHLTTLRLSTSDPMPEEVLEELATGRVSSHLTSIQLGTADVASLLGFLEGRLVAAESSGGAISIIRSVLTYYLRPTEDVAYTRWVALEEAGIQIGRRRF